MGYFYSFLVTDLCIFLRVKKLTTCRNYVLFRLQRLSWKGVSFMSVSRKEGVTVPPLRTAFLGLSWSLQALQEGGRNMPSEKSKRCGLPCGLPLTVV